MHPPNSQEPTNSNDAGRFRSFGFRPRRAWILVPVVFGILGILWIATAAENGKRGLGIASSLQTSPASAAAKNSSVFTPAHRTIADAVKEFFFIQSAPVQPIAFNHKLHIQHGLNCTSCHSGATRGPDAGIPSATFCMACHQVIAADNPEIKKLAAYVAKGQDVPWEPVYSFYPTAHVQFWHAPHINAGVSCEQCHGNISQETVAVKTTELTMRFCLDCHKAEGISVDCTTCHY